MRGVRLRRSRVGSLVRLLAPASAAALLMACSNSGATSVSPHTPSATTVGSGSATTLPVNTTTSPADAGTAPMHGIVVMKRQFLSQPPPNVKIGLAGLDPDRGELSAVRVFFPHGREQVPAGVTSWGAYEVAAYLRQWFSADFTQTSATSAPDSNGITFAGVLHTGDGNFIRLTRSVSGYGTVTSTQAARFNPRTGALWVTSDGHLESVDPAGGASSQRIQEPPQSEIHCSTWSSFAFAPDGYGPICPAALDANALYFPDGTMLYVNVVDGRMVFGKQGTLGITSVSSKGIPLPESLREPVLPALAIDGSRFLVLRLPGTLYLVTHKGGKVFVVSLLPESNKKIYSLVVSPHHDRVAFLSSDGGLYISNLSLPGEPRRVMDLAAQDHDSETRLVDWVP